MSRLQTSKLAGLASESGAARKNSRDSSRESASERSRRKHFANGRVVAPRLFAPRLQRAESGRFTNGIRCISRKREAVCRRSRPRFQTLGCKAHLRSCEPGSGGHRIRPSAGRSPARRWSARRSGRSSGRSGRRGDALRPRLGRQSLLQYPVPARVRVDDRILARPAAELLDFVESQAQSINSQDGLSARRLLPPRDRRPGCRAGKPNPGGS